LHFTFFNTGGKSAVYQSQASINYYEFGRVFFVTATCELHYDSMVFTHHGLS